MLGLLQTFLLPGFRYDDDTPPAYHYGQAERRDSTDRLPGELTRITGSTSKRGLALEV